MGDSEIRHALHVQCGVIARRQVLAAGWTDNDIERLLRRRRWARVREGVYADHTGPLTWEQRAWSAVLATWPAALDGEAALQAHGLARRGPRDVDPIAVVVDHPRRLAGAPGITIRRSARFAAEVQPHLSPPRLRLEVAVLRVASGSEREDQAVAIVADACQTGRTTAARLLAALDDLPRIRHRRLLAEVLRDVATGAHSALERRYLVRVERAHGLPTGHRQRRILAGDRPAYHDVAYVGLGIVVELDGRLGHSSTRDRWADLGRDLLAARSGTVTLRLGWGQVLDAHRLAVVVGEVLTARGWSGRPRGCGAGCPLTLMGGSPAPDAGDPPINR